MRNMSAFGAHSTTDDVLGDRDLSDLRVLVTGASAGLGVETIRSLAARGAAVVGVARDVAKAEAALAAAGVESGVELREADLASLASVRACADGLVADGEVLDVLIANAGVMACPEGTTADGFETQFGTNHLGHFVLVNRLAPLLLAGAPARIVNLSSAGHRFSDVDLDDPGFETQPYDPWVAYGRSKTANVLFAVELDRRLRDRDVRATAIHPGGIVTELGRHLTEETLGTLQKARAASGPWSSSRCPKAPPPRCGPVSSPTPPRSAAGTARTAPCRPSSPIATRCRASCPTPSTPTPRPPSGRGRRSWSARPSTREPP